MNKQQEIQNWILANTQLSQALEKAWFEFQEWRRTEEDDTELYKKEIQEQEKNIGQIIQEIWATKLEEIKKKDQQQSTKPSMEGDCTSYNIHQIKKPKLGLKDITLWRLSIKNFKLTGQSAGGTHIEIQALEYNTKDQKKTKKKKL
ncbi:hypothetical protein pb186bvf_006119 [Paramecium bursaria]